MGRHWTHRCRRCHPTFPILLLKGAPPCPPSPSTPTPSALRPAHRDSANSISTTPTIPGFVLEVRPSGGKTWYLRYRDARGKQHQHRIGDAAGITFEQARTAAQTTRAKVILGENPAEEKRALRAIPTLEDFAQRYLDYVKGAKRSWDTDESFLRNHVLPRWAKRHLDEVRQQDIIDLQHGMRASGYAPATANRIVILTRYMWNLGKKWKVPGTETNPASGVELFEENNKRERFLTAEEVQRLVACVRNSDNPQLQYIVPLLLLLGCRKRELLDSQWSHFDLERRTWRIPLSKNGKARRRAAFGRRVGHSGAGTSLGRLSLRGAEPEDEEALRLVLLQLGHGPQAGGPT